ncbi:Endoplasmic reticulum oxidoreductin-1 [Caenorhabditis elegans]|uniref:Endoplasmic reticulum oxidoreductin-1 n=1 Tax=Caenorhabditis elegans TaxID=6239 RepID=ERO1_CAEEL|nr:Endoplasmic reticulum oxidoreductin-1 [Caenorhabditis elegans]Q7YTU4.2 RecName: Full=Endoplasmic reticulum oxidoreductin-1; Flags: Precursor [Caenorhabditis elegans]CAC70110.4 Endoplasmic reticulum oxidoreductin-1 [Caenorhabditis elegans]|eukprot:NP_001021704.1 Endoplasmic reticulum oxidoreductin-1 [Caenorhabditis elegans]
MREPLLQLIVLSLIIIVVNTQFESGRLCFCKGFEAVEPCDCSKPQTIDKLNNHRIYEKVQKLLKKDFFRFYKVNMDKTCPFWADDRQCGTNQCGIAFCDDEVPAGLRRRNAVNMEAAAVKEEEDDDAEKCADAGNNIDPMDRTLHDDEKRQLDAMDHHDDGLEDKFCEIEDDESDGMHYVDLSKNPERYTGYAGKSPQRVWKSIYEENCFKPDPKFDKNFLTNPSNFGMCLEKRVFYRLISGLHSAITISIAAYNYKPPPPSLGQFGSQMGTWFRNTEMFAGRFGTKWSWEGPQRLRNVYFIYLLELRALLKAAPYLQNELFYTGNDVEDAETRKAVEDLLEEIRAYPNHFDESEMFTGVESHARALREEFRSHFVNISRIMDCVECDKCRLWGKVQTHGMGTALKILFSDLPHSHYKQDSSKFQLTRNEVVALLQSFGRYSSSILEVDNFREDMYPGESVMNTAADGPPRKSNKIDL